MGGGTALQKATGFEDSVEDMYKYVLAAAGEGADPKLVKIYCEQSVDLYNWLVELGVPFKQSYLPGKWAAVPTDDGLAYSGNELQADFKKLTKPVPRGHHAQGEGETGSVLWPPLQAGVEKVGAEIYYDSLAQRLVINPEGRVVGVVAEVEGVEEYIKARKGVILCAGGFAANKEMVARHCPAYLRSLFQVGTRGDDGSGIRMGQGAGGDLRLMGDAFSYCAIYEFGQALIKGILVDNKGRRYIGEDNYGGWVGRALLREHPESYLIVDQAIWDDVPEEGKKQFGLAAQADTVSELARKLEINPDLLENTFDFYNEHAARGEDPAFSKDPKEVVPLKKAPFFAINYPAAAVGFLTTGGLRINEQAEVLDPFGEPVPSLYAAGRNAFAVTAEQYPASGVSVGEGLIFGRIAGKLAVAQEAWS
jgi:3-oxo-5alpha-steroid 4-dehydrogenase